MWLAANKLLQNVSKTKHLMIDSRQQSENIQQAPAVKPSLEIDGKTISMIKDTKYLGVYVDQNLSWGVQITNLI